MWIVDWFFPIVLTYSCFEEVVCDDQHLCHQRGGGGGEA